MISGSHPNTSPIFFYDRGKPFFEFTNFSLHPIEYKKKIYATSEHLFQALKFMTTDPALAEFIRTQPSARSARWEAGFYRDHQRSDWFGVNVKVMDEILHAKFTQHEDLREKLLETGNRELIEDSPDDVFWGIGKDGQGRNELGKALMRLRGQLRRYSAHSSRQRPDSTSESSSAPIKGPDCETRYGRDGVTPKEQQQEDYRTANRGIEQMQEGYGGMHAGRFQEQTG